MCEHYVRIVQSPWTPCCGGMLKINAAAKCLYSVLDRYLNFIKLTTRRLTFILILSCLTKYKLQLKHITIKTILCTLLSRGVSGPNLSIRTIWGSKGRLPLGGGSGGRSPPEALDVHTLILAPFEWKMKHFTANNDIYSEWIFEFWKLIYDFSYDWYLTFISDGKKLWINTQICST